MYVGLDTGREMHQFEVVDANKKLIERGRLPNAGWAFDSWCEHIEELCGGKVVLGLETFGGLASALQHHMEERGWELHQLTPEAVRAYREKVLRQHNKTDQTDAHAAALMVADKARESGPLKHPRKRLRLATRWLERRVRDHTRAANELRKLLPLYWPAATVDVFYRLDLDYVHILFTKCPDPAEIVHLGVDGLTELFRTHGSNVSVTTVKKIVEAARQTRIAEDEKEEILFEVRQLAEILRDTEKREDVARKGVERLVKDDPVVLQLAAPKGVSLAQAATFIAEVQDIANFRTDSHLASYSGHGLRREQTGTTKDSKRVQWRANRHLKRCVYLIADGMRHFDERSKRYYNRKIAEGKKHRQALRCLGRQIVTMFFIMLKHGTVFEPNRNKQTTRAA